MAVNLSPVGNAFQFFTNNGAPLNAGKIYTYQAGSTTPLATYTDNAGLVANTNPIILGTDGRPPSQIWLTEGFFYKFILKDSNDVTIQTYDNLYGIIGTAPTPPTPLPSGSIVLWSGSIGSIPVGWYLCNGSNGTPDLRNRFIVGAGSTYAVDATGGSADAITVAHTHTFSGTTANAGSHTHGFTVIAQNSDSGGSGVITGGSQNATNDGQYTGTTTTAGDHNHTYSGTTASSGTSGTNANLPPYYALCYIMKA
jgi:hypothetical protein